VDNIAENVGYTAPSGSLWGARWKIASDPKQTFET